MDNRKKMLIAVDNDPTSAKIALNGFQLGSQIKAQIALLSVVEITLLIAEGAITTKEFSDITINDYKRNQQMLIETIFEDYKVSAFVEEGIPHEVILNVAKKWHADIIVMGTHGRTGISHLFMGSVAEKVLRHSEIPVFIIPIKS
jgi:nucleotide-binding universal stress UspA family protein